VVEIPTPRDRKHIGVAEDVKLWIEPQNLPFSPTWSTSHGGMSNNVNSSTSFVVAPNRATNITVTASFTNDVAFTCDFVVLEPIDYEIAEYEIFEDPDWATPCGAAILFHKIIIIPATVSFAKVSVMEVGDVAINITGYFTDDTIFPPEFFDHRNSGSDEWIGLDYENSLNDESNLGGLPPPWSNGHFILPIPAVWSVDLIEENPLQWSDYEVELFPNGDLKMSKFGKSITRSINGNITEH